MKVGVGYFLTGDDQWAGRGTGQPLAETGCEHAIVVGDGEHIQARTGCFTTKRPRRERPITRKRVDVKIAGQDRIFADLNGLAHRNLVR